MIYSCENPSKVAWNNWLVLEIPTAFICLSLLANDGIMSPKLWMILVYRICLVMPSAKINFFNNRKSVLNTGAALNYRTNAILLIVKATVELLVYKISARYNFAFPVYRHMSQSISRSLLPTLFFLQPMCQQRRKNCLSLLYTSKNTHHV